MISSLAGDRQKSRKPAHLNSARVPRRRTAAASHAASSLGSESAKPPDETPARSRTSSPHVAAFDRPVFIRGPPYLQEPSAPPQPSRRCSPAPAGDHAALRPACPRAGRHEQILAEACRSTVGRPTANPLRRAIGRPPRRPVGRDGRSRRDGRRRDGVLRAADTRRNGFAGPGVTKVGRPLRLNLAKL